MFRYASSHHDRELDVLVLVEGMTNPAAIVRGLTERGVAVQVAQGVRALEALPCDFKIDLLVFCDKLLDDQAMLDVVSRSACLANVALMALPPLGGVEDRFANLRERWHEQECESHHNDVRRMQFSGLS